jgi:hypothetical protein
MHRGYPAERPSQTWGASERLAGRSVGKQYGSGPRWITGFVLPPGLRRSQATMGRYKTLIGPRLRARDFAAQQTEAAIGVAVLNRMLVAGRPDSVRRQPVTAQQFEVGAISPSVWKCTNAS